jgi:two-component system sensor histidine kinase KdpD
MSRLDKADLRVRRERIDLHELLETVIASTKKILAGHLVDLRAPEKDISIHADRELITMAVTQFLDNAAKYSDPASTITVSTAAVAGEVHIRVHNVGPPIAPDDRQRIFQRFYRSSESSHKAAGTGIGLSISKKVADAHQGRVWVTSEEGSGNTFVLALPRKAV